MTYFISAAWLGGDEDARVVWCICSYISEYSGVNARND